MKEFMRSRQIDTLFHFTRANNLPNIFQYGLLPKESLLDNEIDAEFNDRYRYDGCEDALCASLEFPNYKMFYSLRTDNPDVDWAVIKLDARILLDYDCAFCVTNAGSEESYSVNLKDRMGTRALKKLYEDYPGKPSRQEMKLKDCYPTNPQAEVLIFGGVPVEYIEEVYFSNNKALRKYCACIQAKEDGYFELLLLELSTGLRRGEICALQWDDLNFNTGELQVKRQVHRVKGELVMSEPKTKASNRSVILPPPVLIVLSDYKTEINSVWLFPSPLNNDSPRDPAAVRKRLTTILERADCKRVRFHDLRHTFATASLEHGMDIKTLSTIIGHVSTATTLNVYAHVTDEMRKIAAAKIDRGIAKSESLQDIDTVPRKPAPSTFLPHKGQRRKPGTGCVSQINEKLWEGRYSPKLPNGTRLVRNVYAHSEKECEQKLAELIVQTKAEIAAQRQHPQAPA